MEMKNRENVSYATQNAHPAQVLHRRNVTDVFKDIYLTIILAKILAQMVNFQTFRRILVSLAIQHVLSAKMQFHAYHAIGPDSYFKSNASQTAPLHIFKIIIF